MDEKELNQLEGFFKTSVLNYYPIAQRKVLAVCQALREARAELALHQKMDEIRHERTKRADELWQKAHNKPHTFPDLGDLLEWLMAENERLKKESFMLDIDVIARAIGYEFWDVDNDKKAIMCGMEAAQAVIKALEDK